MILDSLEKFKILRVLFFFVFSGKCNVKLILTDGEGGEIKEEEGEKQNSLFCFAVM